MTATTITIPCHKDGEAERQMKPVPTRDDQLSVSHGATLLMLFPFARRSYPSPAQ